MPRLQTKVKIYWSKNFSYAIGLLAADGSLSKDGRHIWFSSKDREMVENLKKSLKLKNKIGRYARGGEKEKRYYFLQFGDINFYKFLNRIGLYSAKSKTIESVAIPKNYFSDFLRGLFDGDGSFYIYRDKRWPNSFCFKLSIASASFNFIAWLKKKLAEYYAVKGYIHKGDGVYNVEYVKGDSKKLAMAMYRQRSSLYFKKKYYKIRNALIFDRKFGIPHLQKQRQISSPG